MISDYNDKELIKRGYGKDLVPRLTGFNNEDAIRISESICNALSKDCTTSDNKIAIFIGGIPGSGKTTAIRKIKQEWKDKNVICIIGLDNYRSLHPNYKDIQSAINKHWIDKEETSNESKGNDFAYFTNTFAGTISDLVIENLTTKGYNVAIEWGMRNFLVPLKTMETIKSKGYKTIVKFIVVDKETSIDACKLRDDILNKYDVILRRIPEYFHNEALSTIPYSANQIFYEGYLNKKIIDEFELVDRDDNILWDKNSDNDLIETYNYYLNNRLKSYINDPSYGELSYKDETNKY